MNLGIKKMALGSVAALAIAGGAIASCNNKPVESDQEKIEKCLKLMSDMNKNDVEAKKILNEILEEIDKNKMDSKTYHDMGKAISDTSKCNI